VSVWRSDEDMLRASYRTGVHRTYIDGHKTSSDFDRSSFARFRILDSSGKWNGKDHTLSSVAGERPATRLESIFGVEEALSVLHQAWGGIVCGGG
jgi:hypothetical protein